MIFLKTEYVTQDLIGGHEPGIFSDCLVKRADGGRVILFPDLLLGDLIRIEGFFTGRGLCHRTQGRQADSPYDHQSSQEPYLSNGYKMDIRQTNGRPTGTCLPAGLISVLGEELDPELLEFFTRVIRLTQFLQRMVYGVGFRRTEIIVYLVLPLLFNDVVDVVIQVQSRPGG